MSHYTSGNRSFPPSYGQSRKPVESESQRQPSYLAAVGVTHPHQPQNEFKLSGSDNTEYWNQSQVSRTKTCFTSVQPKFPSQNLTQIPEFLPASNSAKHVVRMENTNLQVEPYKNRSRNGLEYAGVTDRIAQPGCFPPSSMRIPGKQIPRAVIAPMSRNDSEHFYHVPDKFSSLPKTAKGVPYDRRIPGRDCSAFQGVPYNRVESCPSGSVSDRKPFGRWSDGKLYTSAEDGNRLMVDHQNDISRSSRQNPRRVFEDECDYINRKDVEKVLNLQGIRKKSSPSASRSETPLVSQQQQRLLFAANETEGSFSRDYVSNESNTCRDARDKLNKMSLDAFRGKPDLDQTSVSSTSTGCASVSSQQDSGYSGDNPRDSLTSQSSEFSNLGYSSPPVYVHNMPRDGGQWHFKPDNAAQKNITSSCVNINQPKTYQKTPKFEDPSSGQRQAKCDRESEDAKYMCLLKKQIKLYQEKDRGFANHDDNFRSVGTESDVEFQKRRHAISSSCFQLETPIICNDLQSTAVGRDASQFRRSMDVCENFAQSKGTTDEVRDLISRKKTTKQNQIDTGRREGSLSDQRTLEFSDSGKIRNLNSNVKQLRDEFGVEFKQPDSVKTAGESRERLRSDYVKSTGGGFNPVTANTAEDNFSIQPTVRCSRMLQDRNDSGLSNLPSGSIRDKNEKTEKCMKKSVSFSDNIALIASAEDTIPQEKIDYVEYATSFLCKRASGVQSLEVTEDQGFVTDKSNSESVSSGSCGSKSRSDSNVTENSIGNTSQERDSDFCENDGVSECSEGDSEGTAVDETGKVRCNLCRRRWINMSEIYCRDCFFYMSKFQ